MDIEFPIKARNVSSIAAVNRATQHHKQLATEDKLETKEDQIDEVEISITVISNPLMG